MTKQQTVRIDAIDFAAGTQVREAINESVVSDYAERMTEGVKFPPVVLFHDGNHYYMADGFHRGLAAKRIGLLELPSEIHAGTKQDALWFALGANKANGQRMTAGDKRHAVMIAIREFYGDGPAGKSQTQIALQVGCDQGYVSKIREEYMAMTSHNHVTRRVVGKDGKNYPASPKIASENPKIPAVREMVMAGATNEAIRKAVGGVSNTTISEVKRDLRREQPIDRSPTAAKQRRERMRRMADDGYSSRQIADALGLSLEGCREILKTDGITVPADAAIRNTRHHDSTRIIERIVQDAENLTSGAELIEYDEIDRSRLSEWITALETSRASLNAFIRQLVKEQQKHGEAA